MRWYRNISKLSIAALSPFYPALGSPSLWAFRQPGFRRESASVHPAGNRGKAVAAICIRIAAAGTKKAGYPKYGAPVQANQTGLSTLPDLEFRSLPSCEIASGMPARARMKHSRRSCGPFANVSAARFGSSGDPKHYFRTSPRTAAIASLPSFSLLPILYD
jgi:hypothetical protein